mgnify:CR=1 FL=1
MANFTNADVMALRQKTGVGMMDCKKALVETNGNIDEAIKYLREKGMATASKKADRIAAEGIVDSYIHMGGKIGVLIEVNCETDFVARSEQFVELVHNLCMQIAAAKPLYVRKEDVEAEKLAEEREILLAQAKNEPNPKPAAVIEKMVEGRINKYYKEVCLLEQDYVKDSSKTVTALINEAVAAIGEKITVRRFVRYEMGEGLEKRQDNFAQEIQEQLRKWKTEPMSEKEFLSAKAQLRSGYVMGLESSSGRMQSLGRGLLLQNELRSPEEVLAKIEAVTPERVMAVAEKVLGSVPAAAVVGQNAKTYLQWMGESKLG